MCHLMIYAPERRGSTNMCENLISQERRTRQSRSYGKRMNSYWSYFQMAAWQDARQF